MCSTEGWKEPICERYGFTYEEKWIQLDITCELMKKLELKKGKNVVYPVYVNSELLNREPEFGGINLKEAEEIFLLKPLTEDKEVQTELSETALLNKEREFQQIRINYTKLEEKLEKIRNLVADNQIDKLKRLYQEGKF